MRKVLWTILTLIGSCVAKAQTNDLPRTSPEAVGIRSEQVSAFFDSLLAYPQTEIHSVMVMRHGKVVGEMFPEPFRPDYKHTQFSCSKTFVAAAVGIAVGENLLRLDDRMVTFFPEHLPKIVSWRLASITVEDLLTMRSGFKVDTNMRNNSLHWIRDYLAHSMNADPGKRFQYDSINTYLLSAIVQRVTGMTVLDYLKQKVFNRLNIQNVNWELSPEGISVGGWGLYIQSESLAKFGQLLLQRGKWHGEQLIPVQWVDKMMARQVQNPKGDDYGYQMWMCSYPGAVRADGAYGQFIVIVPKKDVVVVITQCTLNNGKVERAYIWNTLFQGMKDTPLEASPAYAELLERRYSLPLLEGKDTNKLLKDIQDRTIALGKNPLGWSTLCFSGENTVEITDTVGRKSRVGLGYQQWTMSAIHGNPLNARYRAMNRFSTIHPPFHTGACYAWQDDELQLKIHYTDWMASVLLKLRFDADTVRVVAKENYQQKPVTILGRMLPPTELKTE